MKIRLTASIISAVLLLSSTAHAQDPNKMTYEKAMKSHKATFGKYQAQSVTAQESQRAWDNYKQEPEKDPGADEQETLLWSKSGGAYKGDIKLNQAYTNFDKLKVYGSTDAYAFAHVIVWDTADFDYFMNNSVSKMVIGIWEYEGFYWSGRWLSDKRTFKTLSENARLHKITGVNN